MGAIEWVSLGALVTAVLSLIVSVTFGVLTSLLSRKALRKATESNRIAENANLLADQANRLAAGDAETAMMATINAEWQRVNDLGAEVDELVRGRPKSQLSASERRRALSMGNRLKSAIERVLNAYEVACGRYLDEKCDKVRFKRIFVDEIKKLCENDRETFRAVLKPGPTSPYRAIWRVYDEWHNLEN